MAIDATKRELARPSANAIPSEAARAIFSGLRRPLRFGVEVEHQGLSFSQVADVVSHLIEGSRILSNLSILGPDRRTWRMVQDGGGVELITPVLRGPEDLALVQAIVEGLRSAGGVADHRAGLHVHIDAADFRPKNIQSLIAIMARHEHWLFPVWGVAESRRSHWCHAIDPAQAKGCAELRSPSRGTLASLLGSSRYTGLNLQNYLAKTSDKHTIEFRYLNGTLDPTAVGCAVGFYTAVANRALLRDHGAARQSQEPASLPGLLRELGLGPKHPVAVHLRGLLSERVMQGSRDLGLPEQVISDLTANLADDAYVDDLCAWLTPKDQPRQVARAAQGLLLPTHERRAMMEGFKAYQQRVVDALGFFPTLNNAFCLQWAYGALDDRLLHHLRAMRHGFWDFEQLDRAIGMLLPHDNINPEHAKTAAEMVGLYAQSGREVASLGLFLAEPPERLQALRSALGLLPAGPDRALVDALLVSLAAGEDVQALCKRVVGLGPLLSEDPALALQFARTYPHLDMAEVRSFATMSAVAAWTFLESWTLDQRLDAAAQWISWKQKGGADTHLVEQLLGWMSHKAAVDPSTLQRVFNVPNSELRALHKGLSGLRDALRKSLAAPAFAHLEAGGDCVRLCALVRALDYFPNRHAQLFIAFLAEHTDAEIKSFDAQGGLLRSDARDGDARFELMMLAAGSEGLLDTEARRCLAGAGFNAHDQKVVLDLWARYPKLTSEFIMNGFEQLVAGKISRMPVAMTTRDEGQLLAILSRRSGGRHILMTGHMQAMGLPSWCEVGRADGKILDMLAAGQSGSEMSEALAQHPNPHGIWGDNSMMHWAPSTARRISRSRDSGAEALMRFYQMLGRAGVDLAVGNMHGNTPWDIVGQHFSGHWRDAIRSVISKYASV